MTSPSEKSQQLASSLRAAASRAAVRAGGGLALIFAAHGDTALDLRLRAAAGFESPDDARAAARDLLPDVREAVGDGVARRLPARIELGERAADGLLVEPLRFGDRIHGALVVGCPAVLEATGRQALAELAEHVALRIDHARLGEQLERSREQSSRPAEDPDERSEEVLRLSEALFAQDIELLRSNEKLGKIERLKNDFIEKMSCELRTPLNSIIESVIAVLTGEHDTLSDGSKSTLRSALDDGTAFLRTLQNILDLWRIKQGELPLEIQDVNFRELVDEAIFSVQESIGDKPIAIEQRLADPFPRIRTDLAKLNQLLVLVLENAAKFTDQGRIEIAARVEGDRLLCSVSDTGVGICPDDQQFVFDEFFQVDETNAKQRKGAGLGLALVRDLIVLLEGEISIASDVGRGTTVSFQIPVSVP